MQATLRLIDDELRIVLPRNMIEAAGLSEGIVDLTVQGRELVIRAHEATLEELLSRIDGPPPPMEWEFVEPKGSDVW